MRPAIFRKVTDGVIKLKDIRNQIIFLKKGERIVGYYEMFDGLPGLQFESFGDTLNKVDSTIEQTGNVFNIVNTPTEEVIKSIKPVGFLPPDTEEPPDSPHADKNCPKCHGRGMYHFGGSFGGPIHWSVCECIMFKQEPPPKPSIIHGFDAETLKALKAKTPREWMLVKKHELKKIMDTAGIDYSQVEDDRMALYKFLFSIIKDL
jgi:hypothetical protein